MRLAPRDLLHYGLWAVVLIVVLALEVIPVFLVVTMFSLAVGVPKGPALIVIPVVFVAMIVFACMVATRLTRRKRDASLSRRSERPPALPGRWTSPSQYYRDIKRFD